MKRCKVCNRFFKLKAENKYLVVNEPIFLKALTEKTTVFEAFDCPWCGCQNVVNVREAHAIEKSHWEDK